MIDDDDKDILWKDSFHEESGKNSRERLYRKLSSPAELLDDLQLVVNLSLNNHFINVLNSSDLFIKFFSMVLSV